VTFHGSVPATCERPVHHKLRSQSFTLAERHTHVTGIKNARNRSNSSESSEMNPKVRGRRQSKKIRLFKPIASKLSARLLKNQFKAFNRTKHNDQRSSELKEKGHFKPKSSKLSAHLRTSHFKSFNRTIHYGQRWSGPQKNDHFKPRSSKLSAHPRKSHFKAFKTIKRHVSHPRRRTTKRFAKRLSRLCLFY
jgi:hypothetical protein